MGLFSSKKLSEKEEQAIIKLNSLIAQLKEKKGNGNNFILVT